MKREIKRILNTIDESKFQDFDDYQEYAIEKLQENKKIKINNDITLADIIEEYAEIKADAELHKWWKKNNDIQFIITKWKRNDKMSKLFYPDEEAPQIPPIGSQVPEDAPVEINDSVADDTIN